MKEKGFNNRNIKFFQKIHVQNSALNILLLIMFIAFAVYTLQSMFRIKDNAVNFLGLSSDTLITLGDMKSDVNTVVVDMTQLTSTCESNDTSDGIKKRIASNYRLEIESLYNKLSKQEEYLVENELWSMFEPGKAASQDAFSKIHQYFADVFTALDYVEAGNYSDFLKLIDNEYANDLTAAQTSIAVMEDDVIIVVGRVTPALENQVTKGSIIAYILTGVVCVLIVLSLLFTRFTVSSKITGITNEIGEIVYDIEHEQGDLSKRITVKTGNELSLIVSGFNSFMDTLQNIIAKVKDGTIVLEKTASDVSQRINVVSDNIINTSSAMEELTATMETVSGTATSLNQRMDSVSLASDGIRDQARSGLNTANEIKKSAASIHEETLARKKDATKKVEQLSAILQQSVRDSEKVSQINDLTATIMDIASETNLLSLNASIEAARAGESGRGFTVVAQEIGILADNSHETAENIQEISSEVTKAVRALSENATQIMEFINDTVLSDYDTFGKIGDDYMETSQTISDMVSTFTDKADMLSDTMTMMITDINAISESINESSEAISVSAGNTQDIVDEISEISIAVQGNNDVSDDLTASVAMFS